MQVQRALVSYTRQLPANIISDEAIWATNGGRQRVSRVNSSTYLDFPASEARSQRKQGSDCRKRSALEFLLEHRAAVFSQLLSRRALARSSVDNNFGGFLVAHLARVDDKMVLMRIRNIFAEVAADILLTNTVGSFDVFGGLLFT
jgi:hypothetical protein